MKALLALLFCVSAADAHSLINPLNNPGFDDLRDPSGFPAGWYGTCLPGKGHLVRYEAKSLEEGSTSPALHITVAANHPEQNVAYNVHQDLHGLIEGKTYRVSAKVMTHGLHHLPFVCAQCLSTDQQFLTIKTSPGRELSGDISSWERVETEVTIPEKTATLKLRIGTWSTGNEGGTAIIDDVEIVEVP